MDCGHWLSRRHKATRWDERNAHLECKRCNSGMAGDRQDEMGLYIKEKYGEETMNILRIKKNNPVNMVAWEYEQLINHFKNKLKEHKYLTR